MQNNFWSTGCFVPSGTAGDANDTILDLAQSCTRAYLSSPEAGSSPIRNFFQHGECQAMFLQALKHCLHFARWVIIVSLHFQLAYFVALKKGKQTGQKISPDSSLTDEKVLPFLTFSFVEVFLPFCCFSFILLAFSQWVCFPHMWIFFLLNQGNTVGKCPWI